MSDLDRIRELIQEDVGKRGLRTDPDRNLINACADDFRDACASLAQHAQPRLVIVTGFFIPTGQPPTGETDGPLGAVFLARALHPLGIHVVIASDDFCIRALQAGLNHCGLRKDVPLVVLPSAEQSGSMAVSEYCRYVSDRTGPMTHLLAIERVGPSHTLESVQQQATAEVVHSFLAMVPPEQQDRCHTMRGRDITSTMSPAHRLFEHTPPSPPLTKGGPGGVVTIGIGDGGNEIGMGKIPWNVIRRNIPGGGLVACRIATQHLIVCGISNWGAYGLAAGVRALRQASPDPTLFDPATEFDILERMVEAGPLVDGVTGLPTATVDGLAFEDYAKVLASVAA